ncbi:MAG: PaaI family thioesterase [Anaerovoracaceae bacterium]|jgi:uncharacterized protein (TIGR00369 family)
MSRLKELLEQENFEKDLKALIRERKEVNHVCGLMDPSLIAFDEKEQTITIGFSVLESQLNEHKTMHAGLIAAALDEAMGIFAAYLGNGKPTVSTNITVNYIKPIPMDDSIQITAKVTSLGRRLITMTGECRVKSNGKLSNTALATYAIVG